MQVLGYRNEGNNNRGGIMKVFGGIFVVLGVLTTLVGLVNAQTDIQIGIAVGGVNMFGIGIIISMMANRD
jgi:hypothetical protein